jgi:hypothetical protein
MSDRIYLAMIICPKWTRSSSSPRGAQGGSNLDAMAVAERDVKKDVHTVEYVGSMNKNAH